MQNNTKPLIEFSPLFESKLKQLPSEVYVTFKETLDLFMDNPEHGHLRRHFLKEKYAGYESIDITDDYRAIFKQVKSDTQIIIRFHLIGTHLQLYGKK
jgi:mRNA-degrading endonuclease YafQ of YafQ-DinJ toxin-antitoxin module